MPSRSATPGRMPSSRTSARPTRFQHHLQVLRRLQVGRDDTPSAQAHVDVVGVSELKLPASWPFHAYDVSPQVGEDHAPRAGPVRCQPARSHGGLSAVPIAGLSSCLLRSVGERRHPATGVREAASFGREAFETGAGREGGHPERAGEADADDGLG